MDLTKIKVARAYRYTAWVPNVHSEATADVTIIDDGIRISIDDGAREMDLTECGAVALYHALDSWLHAASGGE